jgi:hypothetical protein
MTAANDACRRSRTRPRSPPTPPRRAPPGPARRPRSGWAVVANKEFADHLLSVRFVSC